MAVLRHGRLSKIICLSWLAVFIAQCIPAYADEPPLQMEEQKIEAGLIYNFLKYTDWTPAKTEATSTPIVICIFGKDPFNGYLQPIEERTVKQRNITIRHVDKIPETSRCHLLVVGTEKKELWPELHEFLASKDVLTVSDLSGFSDAGGMIQFSQRSDRIAMDLNTKAIAEAHLHVQDSLLRLGTIMNHSSREDQ